MNPNNPRMKAALARCRKAIKETPWKDVVIEKPTLTWEENAEFLHGPDKRKWTNYTGD